MSATGRSDTGDTGEEFYPTDPDAIVPLLECPLVHLPGGVWIEPCAGTGRIVRTVNEFRSDVRWRLFEIDERVGRHLVDVMRPGIDKLAPFGDFVHRPWPASWSLADVCMFNPPFSLALDFVKAAMARARNVVMLQRSNWFGTQKRAAWLRAHAPDQYTIAERPSFRPDGGTDSCEYSWFVWPEGEFNRRAGRLVMLEDPNRGQQALAL